MSPAEDDRFVNHGEAAFALYLLHSAWFGGCIGKVSRAARPVLSLLLLVALTLCLFGGYRYIDSSSQASAPSPSTQIPSLLVEMSALKHLKVSPKDAHTATVIFLHGLGDSGHGWLPVAKQLWAVPGLSHVKWILPHAPSIPITLNGGMRMPGWFDLSTLDKLADPTAEDEAGLRRAVEAVDKLVQAEVDAGTPEGRIVLGGFSQGGAVALLTAISGRRKLAGVVALSTWVPLSHKAEQMLTPHGTETPIFWGHGREDPVVRYEFGQRSLALLEKIGYPRLPAGTTFQRPGIRFETYSPMGHSSSPKELADLTAWLQDALR